MPGFLVTYQFTISYGRLRLTSISGPFKGAAHDATAAQTSVVASRLQAGERYHADAIYRNVDWCISPEGPGLTANQTREQRAVNAKIHRARQCVERVIKRFKYDWKIFSSPWRYNMALHEATCLAVAKLTNLNLEVNPLDKHGSN